MSSGIDFLVNRSEFSTVNVTTTSVPDIEELKSGQLLLKVDSFALTANNITYAAMGDTLNYWKFFPKEGNWGIIPVWGFAEVLLSKCDEIAVGERIYGYYPMSTHLVVEPKNITDSGFLDGTEHRQSLSVIYNQYTRSAQDSLYTADSEALQMLLRPLFTTSFLLDDFFNDNNFFAAENIILTSASSKTALGMAFLLTHNRKHRDQQYNIIGLTSPNNVDFVKSLACYDQVITYNEIKELNADQATVSVDFAGNGDVLGQLHNTLADNLKYSCLVGASHWDQRNGLPTTLAGPQPQMFFAPSQAEKRLNEWGGSEFQKRVSSVWFPFAQFVEGWMQLNEGKGTDNVTQVYNDVLDGKFNPATGYVLSLWDE